MVLLYSCFSIRKVNSCDSNSSKMFRCLFGQEAFRALYVCEAGLDIGEHQNITLVHNKIATKMNELKDLNKQLLEKQDKAYELQQQLFDAKQRYKNQSNLTVTDTHCLYFSFRMMYCVT